MKSWPLHGAKIGVIIETTFIAEEIRLYEEMFDEWGATVVFISNLWGQDSLTFDCDPLGPGAGGPHSKKTARTDFRHVRIHDYAAILIAANYVAQRLLYFPSEDHQGRQLPITPAMVRNPPLSTFLRSAMQDKSLVKGFFCHALVGLAPTPELLIGRRVICHEVVLAQIINAGGTYEYSPDGVIVDEDVVTGRMFDFHPDEPARHLKMFKRYVEMIRNGILMRSKR
jgi:hypothetical protein